MRLGVVVSDSHPHGVDPSSALEQDRALVAAARDRVDAVTVHHRWAATGRWNLQAVSYAAFLANDAGQLRMVMRSIPLGVLNPVELAEQLATLDHAYAGRFAVGVAAAPDTLLALYGVSPAVRDARFEESLAIVRKMWAARPFASESAQFRFAAVRPTLRPFQEAGPPLSLGVRDADGAVSAARCGLGVHVEYRTQAEARATLMADYRAAGGTGTASVEVDIEQAASDELVRLRADGFDQVDVRIRRPGDTADGALRRLDELTASARSAAVR